MSHRKIPYKKYSLEITFAIFEVGTKPLVLMLTFLYGKGKINLVAFLTFVCIVQSIGSILLVKSSIYDQSKIGDKINEIHHKKQNNRDTYESSSFIGLSVMICTLNLSSMVLSNIVVTLYKKQKITLVPYGILFVLSFIIGSVPAIVFRRHEYSKRKEICSSIIESQNKITDTERKKGKRNCYAEISCACVEIIAKAVIVMLHFLYGIGTVNYIWFLVVVSLVQLIGSIFFIKNVIYDTRTIHCQLKQINETVAKNSDSSSNHSTKKESAKSNRLVVTCFMLFTQILAIANIPITICYKENKLPFIPYILLSLLLFVIGTVPTVVYRRVQKVEDDFICDEILSNMTEVDVDLSQQLLSSKT